MISMIGRTQRRARIEPTPVAGEDRKTVEPLAPGHPLQTRAVVVHQVQVEVPARGIRLVGGEQDAPAVAQPAWGERGGPERGDRVRAAPVGGGDLDLEGGG